jgi:hypothetical protein
LHSGADPVARKASTRGQKAHPRQLTKRELQELDRFLRAVGGWEQLRQQHKEWRKSPRPKRGRPQIASDKECLAVFGDWFARVPRRMRKEFIARMWQSDNKTSEDKALPLPVREAWDPRRHIGSGTIDSIVRRLEKQLPNRTMATRKALRAKRV